MTTLLRLPRFALLALASKALTVSGCTDDNPPPSPPPGHAGETGAGRGGTGQGGEGESGQAGGGEVGGESGSTGEPAAGKAGRGHGGHSGAGAGGTGRGGNAGTAGTHAGGGGTGNVAGGGTGNIAGFGGSSCDGVDCSGHGRCALTGGTTSCDCDPGFAPSGERGLACTDVDECALAACDVLTSCNNTAGSYICGACPPEYTGNGADGCVAKQCNGAPGVDCPCIKVAPDGDDAQAVAHHGLSPFASIGAALDFVAEDPHVATNVCVAAGAACPEDPLAPPTSFAGPPGDLAMIEGISVYGSYESTGWTGCPRITTELDPQGARGIYFGPEIRELTRLVGFVIARAAHASTAAVTVDGARQVELAALEIVDSPELIAATDTEVITGIDVIEDGEATLTALHAPSQEGSWTPRGRAPVLIGVRSRNSKVALHDTGVQMMIERAQAYGVLLEDSPGSTLDGGHITVVALPPPPETLPGEQVVTALRASGTGVTAVDSTRLEVWSAAPVGSPPNFVGLDLADGADAVLTNAHVSVDNGTGVRSRNARVTLNTTPVYARLDHAYGAWLESSPGSTVTDVTASGFGAIGVHVSGDATGTVIGDVGIFGYLGVELDDCGGASPLISGTITGPANSSQRDTRDAMAVLSRGDCHPRIEDSIITLSTESEASGVYGDFEAIRCESKNGVPSRCVVKNDSIAIRYLSHPGLGVARVAGVRCTGGSCAEVTSTSVAINEVSSCDRSCRREGYGVIYGAPTLVSGIGIAVSCGNDGTYCWDASGATLYEP